MSNFFLMIQSAKQTSGYERPTSKNLLPETSTMASPDEAARFGDGEVMER